MLTFTLAEAKPSDNVLTAFENKLPGGTSLARLVSSLKRVMSSVQALINNTNTTIEINLFFMIVSL